MTNTVNLPKIFYHIVYNFQLHYEAPCSPI